jgi:hypothetical protein
LKQGRKIFLSLKEVTRISEVSWQPTQSHLFNSPMYASLNISSYVSLFSSSSFISFLYKCMSLFCTTYSSTLKIEAAVFLKRLYQSAEVQRTTFKKVVVVVCIWV